MSSFDKKTVRLTSRVIGLLLAVMMLVGLMACDEQAPTNTPQANETSPTQNGAIQREASTRSVVAGQSITLTVTPSEVGGFYAVKDDLSALELAGHTADNYADGVFIMLTEEPFSYTVTVPQCPVSGGELLITGEWWTDPGQTHPMPETTLIC
ncbi:MAG: hypothetical protein QF878_09190 [SAR202 cluster bacterium]|jgi:hypothetical protein|nr:hypothetical protein [SAR202 cluster bacterium]MDP6713607.1 hypothetical protein [SAR202 cluster bacterium]